MLKNSVPDCLKTLANIFSPFAPLYIVGGAVRNSLLNYPVSDFDITSDLLAEKVEEILDGSNFQIVASYKGRVRLLLSADNINLSTLHLGKIVTL